MESSSSDPPNRSESELMLPLPSELEKEREEPSIFPPMPPPSYREIPCTFNLVPPEVHSNILAGCGASLSSASAVSKSWRSVLDVHDGACFKPLCNVSMCSTPGALSGQIQADIAFRRRYLSVSASSSSCSWSWRALARAAVTPPFATGKWRKVTWARNAEKPTHRHSVGTCGAPSILGEESVLLYGGNISRRVAGHWRASEELLLLNLPARHEFELSEQSDNNIDKNDNEEDCTTKASIVSLGEGPSSVWGASLTLLPHDQCAYLFGGWSMYGEDTAVVWRASFRESEVEWSVPRDSNDESSGQELRPDAVAFHTATPLQDGKRFAVVGGLGNGGSYRGVWIYASDNGRWTRASQEGPNIAGHAAGAAGGRLAIFGGVDRTPPTTLQALYRGDAFLNSTCYFDLRKNQWDLLTETRGRPWDDSEDDNDGKSCSSVESDTDNSDSALPTAAVDKMEDDKAEDSGIMSRTAVSESGCLPCPRRNPAYATLGRHMIITGGWDDTTQETLSDVWALDIEHSNWAKFRSLQGPKLEAHKAVISGFDMFTFGGHVGPGLYSGPHMDIECLSLGVS